MSLCPQCLYTRGFCTCINQIESTDSPIAFYNVQIIFVYMLNNISYCVVCSINFHKINLPIRVVFLP